MKKWLVILMAVALTLVFVIGCVGKNGQTGGEQSQEKVEKIVDRDATIVVGMSASILTLDPANHRDRFTETVIRNIFDGLVTRTPDGKIVPEIAESWENVDSTTWEFKIRSGITFHNGEPLTVEDIRYTFDRIIREGAMDGQTSPRKGLLGPLESVEVVDDNTVRFNFSQPWPIFLAMLPHQQIVPKAYLESVGSQEFARKPIGAGPFKFVEGSLDERIVLDRYEDYYGGSPEIPPVGPANAKRVIFQIIPETATRIGALQAKRAHIIQNVPPDMVEMLERDPEINVKMVDGTRMHMFEMNVNMPPFNDKRVRQAVNYAVDMDLIVKQVLRGFGSVAPGPVLPHGFAADPSIKGYGYDPDKAKQLLADAGYANGFAVVIDTIDDLKDVAQAVAGQLREVGIDASVRVWDWGVLKPMLEKGERMMSFTTWGNSTMDPYDLVEPKLKTKDRGNFSTYSNQQVDDLLNRAAVSTDIAERAKLYFEAQQIIFDEAPWLFGYVTQEIEASLANIENWRPSVDSRINMHRVQLVK